jgi:ankyrin repeat protein
MEIFQERQIVIIKIIRRSITMHRIIILIAAFLITTSAGLQSQSISKVVEIDKAGKLIVVKNPSGKPFHMGKRLHIFVGDTTVTMEVTFPMMTVSKCRIFSNFSGYFGKIRNGMDVYEGDGKRHVKPKIDPDEMARLNKALHEGAASGNINEIEKAVEAGADVNSRNESDNGVTPLIAVSKLKRVSIVRYLLSKGADVNGSDNTGRTALMAVMEPICGTPETRNPLMDIVSMLIKKKADVNIKDTAGNTALIIACYWGWENVAYFLIKNGADVNVRNMGGESALEATAKNENPKLAEYLIKSGAKDITPLNTKLIEASQKGDIEVIKSSMNEGAYINANNGEPMSRAAAAGHVAAVRLLIDMGAGVNVLFGAPLRGAAANGHLDTVRLLLDMGAEINARPGDTDTALISASRNGHVEVAKLLIERGADVNIKTRNKATALSEAKKKSDSNNHKKIVEILTAAGAK